MTHAQTQKFTLYTLLLALFILAACGGAKPSSTAGGNGTPGGVDCTATGNAFNAACTAAPAAAAGRLKLCSGTIADLTAAGGSRDACDTPTLANAICVSSGPNANPFAPICISERTRTLEATLTIYEVQETYCTETNFFNHSCTGALVTCDDEGVCSDPVNPLRLTACTDYDGTNATALTNAGGTVASCDSPLLAGVICGTATSVGTNPFAPICSDATGNSDFANIASRQLAYCSENTEAGTCPMVISTFCGTADGPKSQTLCPSQYKAATTAPVTVTAVASKAKTRNVADTAEATVLSKIDGGAYTSYVDAVAGTNRPTFDFGESVDAQGDAKTGVSIIQDGLLLSELVFKESNDDSALTNVANDEGTELANIGNTDGFAIARVDNPDFTPNGGGALDTKARFYAGLLTTTDLGAPLSDRSADGIWTAEFVAIVSDSNSEGRTGRSIATRSTLRVSFADKTIQTREVADRLSPIASGASFSDPRPSSPTDFYDGSRIIIDANFNAEGVIFGESSWIYDGKTSRGSVSGLIGLKGAVGAFVSNGQNNGVNSNGEYAGGFVASNECAIIPFHASCADRHFDGLRAARIDLCGGVSQGANPLCLQAGVAEAVCRASVSPFADICTDNVANQRAFCYIRGFDDGDNAQNTLHYDDCNRTLWSTCGLPDVLTGNRVNLFNNTLCEGNEYDAARGAACLFEVSYRLISPSSNCGDEGTADSYIQAYCNSDAGLTNFRDCPLAYALKNATVVSTVSLADFTRTGENQLLNSNRSGALTAVASGEASLADADTNFITGDADGLDLGLANDKISGRSIFTLNRLEGNDNATSGFAIAAGTFDDAGTDVYKQYVGLLSGTTLGAPLSDAMHGGTWNAKIRIRVSARAEGDRNVLLHSDFKLKVDYATKTLSVVNALGGITNVNFNSVALVSPIFSMYSGKFNENGVIYGTTSLIAGGATSRATLTGLIGQDGAVAIFTSNDNPQADFVGGFVATPTAPDPVIIVDSQDFTKWEDSFDTGGVNAGETLQRSGFSSSTTITADYIKLTETNEIVVHGTLLDTTVLRLNETEDETGYESGFGYAYHTANVRTGTGLPLSQAYAGLLPTTDVGLPLSYLPQFAYWDGKIAGTLAGTDFSDNTFTLHVNYNAGSHAGTIRTVDVQNFDGRTYLSTTNIVAKFRRGNSINSINITGDFDSNGLMFGTVAFNGVINNGTFNGLIGQKGAVGVFRGVVSAFVPYAGGFVVDNPNN